MQVELTAEEATTLQALLRDSIPDLKREIARADDRRFRHQLVLREELCERLIARLDSDGGVLHEAWSVEAALGFSQPRVAGTEEQFT